MRDALYKLTPLPFLQVNAPRLSPRQTGWYLIYPPQRVRRLSWPWWLVVYHLLQYISSYHFITTWAEVEPTTCWS